MNVLHIQSSPRGDKSNSIALTNAFLSASRKVLPVINEDVLNVWDENLPEFDAASIGAKYKAIKHQPLTDAESLSNPCRSRTSGVRLGRIGV
jgi:FMN-dependent NADH-azoreductase